jgi:membrane-bound ClpP family serine protease
MEDIEISKFILSCAAVALVWFLFQLAAAAGDVHVFGKRRPQPHKHEPVVIGKPDLHLDSFIGESGITQTCCRPSGFVLINGRRQEAITDGDFLNAEVDVTVIGVRGNNLTIRQAEANNRLNPISGSSIKLPEKD